MKMSNRYQQMGSTFQSQLQQIEKTQQELNDKFQRLESTKPQNE